MTLFPDAQRKAQEEIDAVVGSDRLPGYADRESLPYVGALVQEVLRWNPVAPLGMFSDVLGQLFRLMSLTRRAASCYGRRHTRWFLHPERINRHC